jgi:hypothetical protein
MSEEGIPPQHPGADAPRVAHGVYPTNGLNISAEDLARWLIALIKGEIKSRYMVSSSRLSDDERRSLLDALHS